jgi:hypothetical protein
MFETIVGISPSGNKAMLFGLLFFLALIWAGYAMLGLLHAKGLRKLTDRQMLGCTFKVFITVAFIMAIFLSLSSPP